MKFKTTLLAATLAAIFSAPMLLPQAALAAAPTKAQTAVQDLGLAPAGDMKEIAISLQLPDRAGLESFVASTVDPTSPNFRKFLTPDQFASRFGQPQAVIDRVKTYLASQGITVTQVYGNNLVLMAQASNAQLAATFKAPIHSLASTGQSYQGPVSAVQIPAALQDVVAHVHGLSTRPIYRSHLKSAIVTDLATPDATPTAGKNQQYSVKDLAAHNNITPLYTAGINGTGTTLGIMTFATFKTSDAAAYWAWAGLTGTQASASRITTVNVGTGQSSNGADETTLDVEQSGGVAPGASIRVYVAPNTDAGAIALYTQAINENKCDTLSISWGEGELYYDASTDFAPYDMLFLQAAAQGTPISASSGDEAAYDMNYNDPGAYPYPNYTALLSLDFPSSSPYVFAAGGTTLPFSLNLTHGTVTVPQERAWGWDYLRNYILSYQTLSYYYANLFPAGGGGGVSVVYPVPSYQQGLAGIVTSAPGQHMFCVTSPTSTDPKDPANTCTPGTDVLDAAAGFAGRNSPDVALNADPESGYALYLNGKWSTGSGGTSFVAPQLNGIFALMTQKLGKRVGWPHPQLYSIFKTMGYGTGSPFRAITAGSNMYWQSTPSYNPATGLGTLDVNNLANALAAAAAPAPMHTQPVRAIAAGR